jgi:DNA ligase-1
MRAQVHVSDQKVTLYSRDLNELTATFPEIPTYFLSRHCSNLVLDGEICVYKDQKIQPFQWLQQRMGVKKPDRKLLQSYPVLFIAYDILYRHNTPLFDQTLIERRERLRELAEHHEIPFTTQYPVDSQNDLDRLFQRAIDHGNEGLVLKRKESTYEYGKRGKSWLKVKEPGGSLDTVIMYAHAGSGKRGGTYSDFTLGIDVSEDERYEEEFIPIGKAYGGYTDEELYQLNDKIRELRVARYGPTIALEPSLMVEVEFDDIQVNKRTKAGYTLRLPRFRAIRWDLSPEDSDTLKDVEALYQQKLNKKRKKQDQNPSFRFAPKS